MTPHRISDYANRQNEPQNSQAAVWIATETDFEGCPAEVLCITTGRQVRGERTYLILILMLERLGNVRQSAQVAGTFRCSGNEHFGRRDKCSFLLQD